MKKGFTLVELLVVIVLIGVLIGIAIPSSIAVSKKVKKKMLDTKIELIEKGAIVWGQNNKSLLGDPWDETESNCFYDENYYPTDYFDENEWLFLGMDPDPVTHCTIKPLSYFLEDNLLEEDELRDLDGNGTKEKVLLNPLTNTPLNDCNVIVYIKNKRVYAKYDTDGYNCYNSGSNYYIELKGNTDMEYILPESSIVLSEYDVNKREEGNGKGYFLKNFVDPGYELKDHEGNIVETKKDDWRITKSWDETTREMTYTYKLNPNGSLKIRNKDKIEQKRRVVKIIDNDAPIMYNFMDNNNEYVNGTPIEFVFCAPLDTEANCHYYSTFDNYDGHGSVLEDLKNIDELTLTDSLGLTRSYTFGSKSEAFKKYLSAEYNGRSLVDCKQVTKDYIKKNTSCVYEDGDCSILNVTITRRSGYYYSNSPLIGDLYTYTFDIAVEYGNDKISDVLSFIVSEDCPGIAY